MLPQLGRLVLVSTLMAAPAQTKAAEAVLEGVDYDATHQSLSIPFSGPVPSFELHQLSPTRAYFEITPARYAHAATLHAPDRGEFTRVTMANRPEAGVVRLSFYTGRPGKPDMSWDRLHHRLLVSIGPLVEKAASPAPQESKVPAAIVASPTPRPHPTPASTATPKPASVTPSPRPSVVASLRPLTSTTETTFKSVYFDNARGLFVMPFTGAVPKYATTQPVPGDLAIDFANAGFAKPGSIAQDLERNALIKHWSAAELPGSKRTTRITLSLAASAEVGVTQDPGLGAMLVIPEPLADSASVAPAAKGGRSRLATPVFDPRSSEMTVTYAGPALKFNVLRPADNVIYIDLPHSELIAGGMPFERVDLSDLVTFWLLASRPAIDGQRLILHVPFGGQLNVKEDAPNKKVTFSIARQAASPTPRPSVLETLPIEPVIPGPVAPALPASPVPLPSLPGPGL